MVERSPGAWRERRVSAKTTKGSAALAREETGDVVSEDYKGLDGPGDVVGEDQKGLEGPGDIVGEEYGKIAWCRPSRLLPSRARMSWLTQCVAVG